jgi:hypothetical protein
MTYRHYQSLLPAILFILSACEPFQTIITHPAESDLTQVPAIVNPSLTPSVSQEPDWYQPLVPLDQPLEYQYALVTDPQVKVYIRLQDAENDTLQYSRLPIIPGYVAYVGIERQGDDAFYHLASGGWIKEEDLQEITPSSFAGILLAEEIDFRFDQRFHKPGRKWISSPAISTLPGDSRISLAGQQGRLHIHWPK